MKNFLLSLRFDGSAFHGSQRQAGEATVQQALEDALFQILRQIITVKPCSRTDAGVHANEFCCNFFSDVDFEPRRLIRGLNAVLPRSIAVFECREVPAGFNAQKSCVAKEYVYRIWNAEQRNPFEENRALHFPRPLDENMLDVQAKSFAGTHDFSAFCASGSSVKSTIRTVFETGVRREGDLLIFTVKGDGFLYNMVRIMVGTLLDISDGKLEKGSIPHIIESRSRENAGVTAPACGLYLNKVFYSEIQ